MTESSREAWARSVAETHLGVELGFADSHGCVDYMFTDPTGRAAAMEVTTLTDRQLKRSVDAYTRTRNLAPPMALLGSCWSASVDERDARFRGLEARLERHLAVLEGMGVEPGRWLTPCEIRAEHPNADVEASVASLASEKVRLLMRWTPEFMRGGSSAPGAALARDPGEYDRRLRQGGH